VGDEFDPRIHEALMHGYSDEVAGPTCSAVLQVGYRLGDRIVRPARVAVAEPQAAPAVSGNGSEPGSGSVDATESVPVAGGADGAGRAEGADGTQPPTADLDESSDSAEHLRTAPSDERIGGTEAG
jgi:molecular chaperone GrpE